MYVGHQNTDNLVIFNIDRQTGKLEYSGHDLLSPGQPVCILFNPGPRTGNTTKPGVTFWIANNPVLPDNTGLGRATLAWNAPGVSEVEIRLRAPNGMNMGRHYGFGTATTDRWVSDGMVFYLQDVSGGKPLTSENTLGTVRAELCG
jgi:hypothetical protein